VRTGQEQKTSCICQKGCLVQGIAETGVFGREHYGQFGDTEEMMALTARVIKALVNRVAAKRFLRF